MEFILVFGIVCFTETLKRADSAVEVASHIILESLKQICSVLNCKIRFFLCLFFVFDSNLVIVFSVLIVGQET